VKVAEKETFDGLVSTTSEAETGRQEAPLRKLPERRRKQIQRYRTRTADEKEIVWMTATPRLTTK
jgi:hypothetical protein